MIKSNLIINQYVRIVNSNKLICRGIFKENTSNNLKKNIKNKAIKSYKNKVSNKV